MKTARTVTTSFLLSLSLMLISNCAPGKPKAIFPIMSVDFGKVIQGSPVEPEFVVRNSGSAPLQIQKVNLTAPLKVLVTKMPSQIPPGSEGVIRLKLETTGIEGEINGEVSLTLNDPSLPEAQLELRGKVVGPIELSPLPAFFVTAQRGETKSASIDIINHESQPIRIEQVESPTSRFTTQLETIQDGQQYRLHLTFPANGTAGKQKDTILLKTSSLTTPTLKVIANTYLHERVYAFPDGVDFGKVSLEQLRRNPNLLLETAQQFMVYRKGDGAGFQVKASSDVPGLNLNVARGSSGDSYQVTVSLNKEKLEARSLNGSIVLHTTDSEFPKITVPVSGIVN